MSNVHPVFEGMLESFIRKEFDKGIIRLPGTDRETVKPEGWENFSPEEQLVYLSGESDGFCRGLQQGYLEGVKAMRLQHRKKMAELEKYLDGMNGYLNIAFREILDEDMPLDGLKA